MNLRIITFLRNEGNIGQRLQAFALQRFLWNNFHEKALIYDIRDSIELKNRSNLKNVVFNFDKNLWLKKINSLKDIENDSVDYFIMGSDQIFNPVFYDNKEFHSYYTLDFIDQKKKIPYASSSCLTLVQNLKTNSISFRESINKEELKSINYNSLCNDININIDPVLLLSKEEYSKYSIYKDEVRYINDNNIYYNQIDNKEEIETFLYRLSTYDGIIYTTSYHMFILSIIYNRRIDINYNNLKKDNRIKHVIKNFGIKYSKDFRIENYSEVESKIFIEKENTLKYFKKYLV